MFLLGSASVNEEELASKTLHIQSKRFYLDVKQNQRGRFLKISEVFFMLIISISLRYFQVSTGGRKTRILMSMNVANELRDHLHKMYEYLRTLGNEKVFILEIFILFYR